MGVDAWSVDAEIQELQADLCAGHNAAVAARVERLIRMQVPPDTIVNDVMVRSARALLDDFSAGVVQIPELLAAGAAFRHGVGVARAHARRLDHAVLGRISVASVYPDSHDAGNQVVAHVLAGLGVELTATEAYRATYRFAEALTMQRPVAVGDAPLAATDLPYVGLLLHILKSLGIRNHYVLVVSGPLLSGEFAKAIGTDLFVRDIALGPSSAVELLHERSR